MSIPQNALEKTPKSGISGPVIDMIKKKADLKISSNDQALIIKSVKGSIIGQDRPEQT